ncbi:MAG: ribonuclease III [Butyricicoccus sp.]|nr:ribonuclease III [Butyricicoccus sp.]
MNDYLNIKMPERELGTISTLGLAHVGDGVYELMVRSWIACRGRLTSSDMHRETVKYVRAPAQAEAAGRISDMLTEPERAVYRRGRNAHVNSVPKNAQIGQYHAATGLECLFGWLYLRGEHARLGELFEKIMEME